MDQQSTLVVTGNSSGGASWRPLGNGPWFEACFGYRYTDNSRRLGVTLVGSKVTRSSSSSSGVDCRSRGVHITMNLLGPPIGLETHSVSNVSLAVNDEGSTSVTRGFSHQIVNASSSSNISDGISLSVQRLNGGREVCGRQTFAGNRFNSSASPDELPARFSSVFNVNYSDYSTTRCHRTRQDVGSVSNACRSRLLPSGSQQFGSSAPDLSSVPPPIAGSWSSTPQRKSPESHMSMMNLHLSAIPPVLVETVPFHKRISSMSLDEVLAASMEQIVEADSGHTAGHAGITSPGSQKILELVDKQSNDRSLSNSQHSGDAVRKVCDSSDKVCYSSDKKVCYSSDKKVCYSGDKPPPCSLPVKEIRENNKLSIPNIDKYILPEHGKHPSFGCDIHRAHSDRVLSGVNTSVLLQDISFDDALPQMTRSLEDVLRESFDNEQNVKEQKKDKFIRSDAIYDSQTVIGSSDSVIGSQFGDGQSFKPVKLGSGPPITAIRVPPLVTSSPTVELHAVANRGHHHSDSALDVMSLRDVAVTDVKRPLANMKNSETVVVTIEKKVDQRELFESYQVG
ncbi:hypothetical protein LSH36_51g05014 [Paralvinella palmiformis]|uniref:Uncharacterized protein n=1 Tax=Paralvinella palmiformis TaxID=53620 RepID=A0AAD9NFL1_9ANNE|nr:hypothetical protein LSH36_51g05014 [Paralvinella palmiformis]